MGRPYLYAMGGYGEEGVNHLANILKSELVTCMKLMGTTSIEEISKKHV
jgi:L-lactate dehydrogenase (cytochrome)